jgi:hypothetical protein
MIKNFTLQVELNLAILGLLEKNKTIREKKYESCKVESWCNNEELKMSEYKGCYLLL